MLTKTDRKLPYLKKLDIHYVYFANPEFWSTLLDCPLLEELCLSDCSGLENVELFGQDRLKIIETNGGNVKMVDINILNVNSLSVAKDLGTFEIDIMNFRDLKILKLELAVIKVNLLSNIILGLLKLECLSLLRCVIGKQLKISSISLERLEIINWDWWTEISNRKEDFVELEIDTLNLSYFNYGNNFINLCYISYLRA